MRLRNLFRKGAVERELDEELRFHIENQVETYVQAGMSAEEARRRAVLAFGGVERAKEECRDARGISFGQSVLQDIRYGCRILARSPMFTAVAVLSLALGIGANTAIFSLLDAAMLRTLPVKRPEQLVQVTQVWPGGWQTNVESAIFEELRRSPRSLSGVFAFLQRTVNLRAGGASERVEAQLVTGDYYSTLGVPAFLGRTLTTEDDRPASEGGSGVLSYSFWASRFGRDPAVLGKTVYLDGLPVTVVGVTPPEFFGLDLAAPPDITVPLGNPADFEPWIWARLKPGVSIRQAQLELEVGFQRVLDALRPSLKDWSPFSRERRLSKRAEFRPAGKGTPGFQIDYGQSLQVLVAFAGVVLLIACANIANLLLARSAARASEIGLRLAIGAGRRRLVRQLLTESILLSLLGAALGLFFALWGHRVLLALLVGENVPRTLGFRLDYSVLAFTAAVSVLTGVLFGVAPALRATRADVFSALKRDRRHGGGVRQRLAKSLVVVQVAASVVLLVGAGLFARTLRNLRTVDPGFRPEEVLTMRVDAAQRRAPDAHAPEFYRELIRRIRAVPGVKAASLGEILLFGAGGYWGTVWADGYPDASDDNHQVGFNNVGPNFFQAAGVSLLAGREFSERDDRSAPEVVIVNEALARKYWPNESPVGKRLGWPKARSKFEIIGVARNTKYRNLRQPVPPMVYYSLLQQERLHGVTLHVRTAGAPALMAPRIRQEIQALDKDLPVYRIETLAEGVDRTLRRERMFAALSGFFGLLALALTCVGLYGVIAYAVTRRTNEIGVRIALGATRPVVVWMVLRETLMLVAAGAFIGVPAALASTRLIRGLLFGLTPTDPATIAAATLLLAALGALAGYLPARRAASLDPLAALRYE